MLRSGSVAFPPIIDTKIDQPEIELVMSTEQGGGAGTERGDGAWRSWWAATS